MKPAVFRTLSKFVTISTESSVHCRTRGGEWWGCIAAFKIFRKNCCGLDVHKTWIYACIGITDTNGRTEYKQARFSSFTKGLQELADWLAKYDCNNVCMESSGKFWIPVFNILEKTCWVTLAYPKYTKPQKGNKTDHKDAKWICDLYMCDMVNPSFIPPPDIRQLRDLMRYRSKLTNIMTSEKNWALNCLTVSNLKLDDVFSDVFGKSSRSVIRYILEHPGETFQVAPFIDRRCKHPVEEIQAVIDGTISHQQAVKLRECLQHLDELEVHKTNVEKEILCLVQQYPYQLELLQTVPGFSGNIMTAIALISEIGADMSVFPSAKHLVSWAGCCPRNDQSSKKVKSTRISRAGVYLKPLLVQVAIQPFTANADKLSAAGALEIRCQICDGRFLSMWAALFIFLGCPLPPCPKNLHVHNGRIVILASVAWIF